MIIAVERKESKAKPKYEITREKDKAIIGSAECFMHNGTILLDEAEYKLDTKAGKTKDREGHKRDVAGITDAEGNVMEIWHENVILSKKWIFIGDMYECYHINCNGTERYIAYDICIGNGMHYFYICENETPVIVVSKEEAPAYQDWYLLYFAEGALKNTAVLFTLYLDFYCYYQNIELRTASDGNFNAEMDADETGYEISCQKMLDKYDETFIPRIKEMEKE